MTAITEDVPMPDDVKPSAPVSVIIPCHNCTNSIVRAVQSVVAQTLKPAEVILVDDASTDDTAHRIAELQSQYGKEWVRAVHLQVNCGPGTARNAGWEVARQPYVAFLDADDTWHEDKIDIQYRFMRANTDVAMSGHGYRLFSEKRSAMGVQGDESPRDIGCRAMLTSNCFATRTVMLKRNLAHRFADGKRYCEDYQLWLQIICNGQRAVFLPHELAYVYKADYGEGGLSSRLWKMEWGELGAIWSLVAGGTLNVAIASLASAYSLIKYGRREVIVWIRKATRSLRN